MRCDIHNVPKGHIVPQGISCPLGHIVPLGISCPQDISRPDRDTSRVRQDISSYFIKFVRVTSSVSGSPYFSFPSAMERIRKSIFRATNLAF